MGLLDRWRELTAPSETIDNAREGLRFLHTVWEAKIWLDEWRLLRMTTTERKARFVYQVLVVKASRTMALDMGVARKPYQDLSADDKALAELIVSLIEGGLSEINEQTAKESRTETESQTDPVAQAAATEAPPSEPTGNTPTPTVEYTPPEKTAE